MVIPELNYFGARYLDPMLGLWTSVDPARQFASPYLYAGNGVNPVNGVDPDGNVTVGVQVQGAVASPTIISASAGITYSIMFDFNRFFSGKWPLLYSVSAEIDGGIGGGGGISLGGFANSDSPELGMYQSGKYDVNILAGGGIGLSVVPSGEVGRYDASISVGTGGELYVGGGIETGNISEMHFFDMKLQDMIENPENYME